MKNHLKKIWNKFIEGGKEKAFWRIVTTVLVIVLIFSGIMSIKSQINKKRTEERYHQLQEMAKVTETEENEKTKENEEPEESNVSKQGLLKLVSDYPKIELDYQALEKINSDIVGWIYIPALDLSYPVVKYKDDEYYLDHSFEKKSSILGCIFMDYESPSDWTDFNTLIFGHNMRDQSMFGSLKRFIREEGLLKSEPYIYIYTEEEILIYHIFSLYIAEDGSQRYRIVQDENDLAWYVKEAKELSMFDPEVEFAQMDYLISLSTCYGAPGTSNRLLLHAVLEERGVREALQPIE